MVQKETGGYIIGDQVAEEFGLYLMGSREPLSTGYSF